MVRSVLYLKICDSLISSQIDFGKIGHIKEVLISKKLVLIGASDITYSNEKKIQAFLKEYFFVVLKI